jgi:triphosphoribosyl-dephospho-CoA synthase
MRSKNRPLGKDPAREPDPGTTLPLGVAAHIACILEVAAPKAGNVYPGASFPHLSWVDFAAAAAAIAPEIERAPGRRIGETVLAAVRASLRVTPTNANVGIVLLLAPLARAAGTDTDGWRRGVERELSSLDAADAADVYAAIALASPKGLGSAPSADVHGAPPLELIPAMRLAEDRDRIARQYSQGFVDIFDVALPVLLDAVREHPTIEEAIVRLQLELLRRIPDTHIARRCGVDVSERASRLAAAVLTDGWPGSRAGRRAFDSLDKWLREDDNRRNPGTTADMIAAALFVALRVGAIPLPLVTKRG